MVVASTVVIDLLAHESPVDLSSEAGVQPPDRSRHLRPGNGWVRSNRIGSDPGGRTPCLARDDPLTGLPNRTMVLDRPAETTARTQRQGGAITVLLVDIKGFRDVETTPTAELLETELLCQLGALVAPMGP